jgi:hypothetical protein
MDPADHRREPDPLCVGGQERERRVALRFVGLGAAHDRVLPEVVRHPDAVEARLLRGPRDLGQLRGEAGRSAFPVEAVYLQSELHRVMSPFLVTSMSSRVSSVAYALATSTAW